MKCFSSISALLICFVASLSAQTPFLLKTDDFEKERAWWDYHRDGTVANDPGAFSNGNGYLKMVLNDPVGDRECNVGISERQPVYGKEYRRLVSETRARVLNPMKEGSRGWGFWKTAKQGKADNIVWFMQQLLHDNERASWSRFGAIYHQKADFIDWLPDEQWRIYKIVRDRDNGVSTFWVDGKLVYEARLAPAGDMAYHAWVDNQIYDRSVGIRRAAWPASSTLILDYVQIYEGNSPEIVRPVAGGIRYFGQLNRFLNAHNTFELSLTDLSGETVVLASARAEDLDAYDQADVLSFKGLNLTWHGQKEQGTPANKMVSLERQSIQLQTHITGAPYLSNLCVLSGGRTILNMTDVVLDKSNQKEIEFDADGPGVIYISATLNESPGWNHVQAFTTGQDKLKLQLDGKELNGALDGNILFGDNGVLLQKVNLSKGRHTLVLKAEGSPSVQRVLIYREGD